VRNTVILSETDRNGDKTRIILPKVDLLLCAEFPNSPKEWSSGRAELYPRWYTKGVYRVCYTHGGIPRVYKGCYTHGGIPRVYRVVYPPYASLLYHGGYTPPICLPTVHLWVYPAYTTASGVTAVLHGAAGRWW